LIIKELRSIVTPYLFTPISSCTKNCTELKREAK
jgi:hypothetical protein